MNPALLLDQRRASVALRCTAALLFSIAFLWPAIGTAALVEMFAAYAFIDGILTVSAGGWSRTEHPVWPLLIGGWIDIAAAATAFFWPDMPLAELATLVTIWAMAMGLSFAMASLTLRDADGDHLLLLSGVAGVLFGRALLSHLGAELIVVATWMGLYALTSGILLFKLSIQLYRPIAIDVSAP